MYDYDEIYMDEINMDNITQFSLEFEMDKRIYLGKDIKKLMYFLKALQNEYRLVVDMNEFGDYSVLPVHKEYDEVDIRFVPWE